MPQKVKQAVEHIAIPNKPTGNSKCVNAKKVMDSHGSGAHTQDSSTTNLYPANTRAMSHGSEVRESMV